MVFEDDSVNKAAAYMREHGMIPERMHIKQVLRQLNKPNQ